MRRLNTELGPVKEQLPAFAEPADEDLPGRFTEEPLPNGPARGMTVAIQPMVRDFYAAMGWDADGRPTPEKLQELGLEQQP